MRLYAFTGLHYDFADPRAGDLAAPPYDQIDDRLRNRLQASSAHQLSHLTRPLAGAEGDPYRHAARLHREWLERGIVERDGEPSIYPYVIVFPHGERRLGVTGLVALEPPDSPAIRPHEKTLDRPLADRLALLRAMRVDLEPALLLSDDDGELDALLASDVAVSRPLVEHRDTAGNRHLLFRMSEPPRIARYREVLARGGGAIADGHHRYKVAQRFADEIGAQAGSAAATKLAVVTSLHSPALTIDPIHRALREPPALDRLGALIASREPWPGSSGSSFAAAVAAAPTPSIGVLLRGVTGPTAEIWRLDPAAAPAETPVGARGLPVVLLHDAVFPHLGLAADSATDGTVLYRSDSEDLFRLVDDGEAAAGFFLPPMSPQAFAAAIADGDLLPPKSTRFLPKVVSGLVWSDHFSTLG